MAMIPPGPAGNPPGGPPPGMGQPRPPIGGPPSPMPPQGGAMAPPQAPAPPAPPPAAAAPGAAQGVPPVPSPYSDLSAKMPHAYQLLDAASRTIRMAIETGGFYKQPHVLAGVRKLDEDLRRIIQSYAKSDANDTPPRPTNVSDGAGFDSSFSDDDEGNDGEAAEAPPM